jgi:hypothetical protein
MAAEGDPTSANVVNTWKSEVESSKKVANGTPQAKHRDINPQKEIEKLGTSVLLSAVTWDVFMPPPRNSVKVGTCLRLLTCRLSGKTKSKESPHMLILLSFIMYREKWFQE